MVKFFFLNTDTHASIIVTLHKCLNVLKWRGGERLMQGKNVQANGQLFFQLALVK